MSVSANVSLKLACPILGIRGWSDRFSTAFMLMPEASVHEDNSIVPAENHIRRPGQPRRVKPETQSRMMQCFAHSELGCGISAPNGLHDFASLACIEGVGQKIPLERSTSLGDSSVE